MKALIKFNFNASCKEILKGPLDAWEILVLRLKKKYC